MFFIDEASEEVLQQSDAMTSFFGRSVDKILPAKIFELKENQSGEFRQIEQHWQPSNINEKETPATL